MQKSKLNVLIQKIKNFYHLLQALLANIYFEYPSRKLKVIGITGTDGKTTTTHLIYHVLKTAGKKVSMISSVYAKIGNKEYDTGFHVTTPDVFPLQKLLSTSVKNKDEYFVLETTSHALYQNRVFGINYEVGVLTNITHEHLDMHHSMEEYTNVKLQLIKKAKFGIINEDDPSFLKIKAQRSKIKNKKIITYGKKDFNVLKHFNNLSEFNMYNYLAAYKTCQLLGISSKKILQAMKTFQLPRGRLEVVLKKPFTVIIDFAHTPNALQAVLKEVRKKYLKKNNRLIHVFGSAAKRDITKRPLMGEVSGTYADLVILTEEDYRNEDPFKIAGEIAEGLNQKGFMITDEKNFGKQTKTYTVIVNREKAIKKAVNIAKKGDVIITTGKGHEKSLCRGNKEYLWDERMVIIDEIKKRLN